MRRFIIGSTFCARVTLILALAVIALASRADVLEMKGGQIIRGNYIGGTAATIRIETDAGVQVIEKTDAVALTFSAPPKAAVAPAPAQAAAPAAPVEPAATTALVTVPAGAVLLVRMSDPVSSADPKGKRFAAVLETDLQSADGRVAIPAGTKAFGRVEQSQQARRLTGQSLLDIRLTEVNVDGVAVPISTGPHAQAGERSIKKTAKGTAAGLAVAAIADEDAGKGAAVGALASGIKRGEAIAIQAGQLLEFQMRQPLTLNR